MTDALTIATLIAGTRSSHWRVITACTVGGLFEWYDFYAYAALASVLSAKFFPPGNETAAFMSMLATFGAAFLVRPVGALFFGRLGDRIGRKVTFIVTMSLMGLATLGVGLLPTYETAGIWAAILLVTMRLIQGFAHGGETGGAIVYLAEYAPVGKRGLLTSVLQTTACLGLMGSIIVTLIIRSVLTPAQFQAFGWRMPFLMSIVLLSVSVYIRSKLSETPIFKKMESAGAVSRSPLRDALRNKSNLLRMLIVFGPCAGLGAIFGTSLFHSMFFLTKSLNVPVETAQFMICIALIVSTPFYPVFGWLSDRFGRRPVLLSACLATALTTIPLFHAMTHYANPKLEAFQTNHSAVLEASNCQFHVFSAPASDCDKVSAQLAEMGVPVKIVPAIESGPAILRINDKVVPASSKSDLKKGLIALGWPDQAEPGDINYAALTIILFVLNIYLALGFAPLAAYMAESFPAKIRYTSCSFPFHLGAGWIGGFLPFVVAALNSYNGNFYAGLWYPVAITSIVFLLGGMFMKETHNNPM